MKITSGEFKYRKLEVPKEIRPTTEKVREAVFSMINERIPGAVVLDLFAGSGSLGLEALSRGAEHCCFNEMSRKNFLLLKKNIENCRAINKSTITNSDFRKCLDNVNEKFDIVFLDPPYAAGYYNESFQLLQTNHLLKSGGIVIAEHLYDNPLLDKYLDLCKSKEKKYGTIGLDIYTMA